MNPADLYQTARAAMRERGLEPDFAPDATRQAAALDEAVVLGAGAQAAGSPGPPGGAGPFDLRHLPWCSIDNDDSRDLDQLTVIGPGSSGATCLLVAVADVDVLVPPGSPIDAHAGANTTSVYTDAGVFPMLPLRLSTNLSSLNEGVDRWAIVVEIALSPPSPAGASVRAVESLPGARVGDVAGTAGAGKDDADGFARTVAIGPTGASFTPPSPRPEPETEPRPEPQSQPEPEPEPEPRVYRALVRSQAQLTYDAVAAWLDGEAPMPPKVAACAGLDQQLRAQDRAGADLTEARRRRGALGLSTPEARPVFDAANVLTDLRVEAPSNRAKDFIAAFMIAANGVTARFLDRAGFPSLRRFLRAPERWQKIVEVAAGFGATLPAAPDAVALDAFLTRRRLAAPERFAELSLTIVKLLGSGEYVASRPGAHGIGHFGLAVTDYAHSTAPNRRYPDLVTQRLLKAAFAGAPPPYTDDELGVLAQHCTEQEDNAKKVERQVRKTAVAFLLAPRIGTRFDAIVTGVNARGTWVRIEHPVAEGRVVQGMQGLDVGDKTEVELVGVDAARGYIDFRSIGG